MRSEYLILHLLSLSVSIRAHPQPAVMITNGTLLGTHNSEYNQDLFLGIPYAQPPVRNLRFNYPQPINQSWSEKQANTYGLWCHSSPLSLPGFTQTGFEHYESKDCLTLNVVRPGGVKDDVRLLVLVWIHGGGFWEGSGADQRYNMSFLVQESVSMGQLIIGVSFNYWVSGFGFLQGRAVNESRVANLSLYDQQLALHWTQENIAAFGGDPSWVTIQGESSGAISVGHHFLAYGGCDDGLFHAGIAESGGPLMTSSFLSLDQQDSLYKNILNATNCLGYHNTLQCLCSRPAHILKATFQNVSYYPVIDGGIITGFSSIALKEGHFVKRPLLIGSNTNEGAMFTVSSALGVNNFAEFQAMITQFSGGNGPTNATIDAFAVQYLDELSPKQAQANLSTVLLSPSPAYGSVYGRVTLYVGDFLFIAGRRYATQMWDHYGVPAFSYRFDAVPHGISPETLGVTHFQEIPFVFRNFDGVGFQVKPLVSNSTEVQKAYRDLSTLMSRMWLSFANTLSPNVHGKATSPLFCCCQIMDCFSPTSAGLRTNETWPVYKNGHAENIVFRLNSTHLEPDTWRSDAIGCLMDSLHEFKV